MKNFLYVLVDGETGAYANLTLISVKSLRAIHPECNIKILCDNDTHLMLQQINHSLLTAADEIKSIECPNQSNKYKSRYIKINMRKFVSGHFVYLDSDTIIRKPLDEMFEHDEPIGLVRNHNRNYPDNLPETEKYVFNKLGRRVPISGEYYNGGIISWRDNFEGHAFSEAWSTAWVKSANLGMEIDQPALNYAVATSGISVKHFDDRFNAQVRTNPATALNAHLWHFFETNSRIGIPDVYDIARSMFLKGEDTDDMIIPKVLKAQIHYLLKDSFAEAEAIELLKKGRPLDLPTFENLSGTRLESHQFATVCTIVSSDYLPYAWTLLESVRKFNPLIHVNIMLTDEDPADTTVSDNDAYTYLHQVQDVCQGELGIAILNKYRPTDDDAFRWSCKPLFINHLIRSKGYEQVIYVDCDIHFFDSFEFLHDALRIHRVLLTPHWRTHWPSSDSSEYRYLFNHGLYNAGFIGVASTATDIMDWWAECCLHSCEKGSFEGEYVDQSILNLMPVYYEGVHILKHKGCNVAIWNRNECARVSQPDGRILIDNKFPVIFIHFVAGINRRSDYMLSNYFNAYLNTLKKYSTDAWNREMDQRKSGRDPYQEKLPTWHKKLKNVLIKFLSEVTFFRKKQQILILSHPGTSIQCLTLWLRTIQGTVVSGMPVKEWSNDPVDDMHFTMEHLNKTPESFKQFQTGVLNGTSCDRTRMHWENPGSLLRWKYTLLSMPEGSLCWRTLCENMADQIPVIALISNPFQFALRMKAEEPSEWATRQLREADHHLRHDPKLIQWKEQHQDAFLKWIVKWCIDLKHMTASIKDGLSIHLLFEDELRNDTDKTLKNICNNISLPYPESVSQRFNKHCVFLDTHGRRIPGENWRQLVSDAQYETAQDIIGALGIHSIPGL